MLFDIAGRVALVTGSSRGIGHALVNNSSWNGRWRLLVCVRSHALNSLICIFRSCVAEISAPGGSAVLPSAAPGDEVASLDTGIVEARSGLFDAGLDAAFRFPRAGRGMLKLPRTWGSATEIPGSKVTSVAPSCLTTAAPPSPQQGEFPQVRVITVRQAGLEPATHCLEGRFTTYG
jgi:hypothetical protein